MMWSTLRIFCSRRAVVLRAQRRTRFSTRAGGSPSKLALWHDLGQPHKHKWRSGRNECVGGLPPTTTTATRCTWSAARCPWRMPCTWEA